MYTYIWVYNMQEAHANGRCSSYNMRRELTKRIRSNKQKWNVTSAVRHTNKKKYVILVT